MVSHFNLFVCLLIGSVCFTSADLVEKYRQIIVKHCVAMSGPNAQQFDTCFEEENTKNPPPFSTEEEIKVCLEKEHTKMTGCDKSKTDEKWGTEYAKCAVDFIEKSVEGSKYTTEQAMDIKDSNISKCIKAK